MFSNATSAEGYINIVNAEKEINNFIISLKDLGYNVKINRDLMFECIHSGMGISPSIYVKPIYKNNSVIYSVYNYDKSLLFSSDNMREVLSMIELMNPIYNHIFNNVIKLYIEPCTEECIDYDDLISYVSKSQYDKLIRFINLIKRHGFSCKYYNKINGYICNRKGCKFIIIHNICRHENTIKAGIKLFDHRGIKNIKPMRYSIGTSKTDDLILDFCY